MVNREQQRHKYCITPATAMATMRNSWAEVLSCLGKPGEMRAQISQDKARAVICLQSSVDLSYTASVVTNVDDHSISSLDDYKKYMLGKLTWHYFPKEDLIRNFNLSANGSDVILFLRIQKTGSTTFAKHIEKDLNVSLWCHCKNNKCGCVRKWKSNVLFERTSNEWPCAVHADWTYLHECAETAMNKRHGRTIKQRHLYMTMVRDPLRRFVSEWQHVRRGATWLNVRYTCNGHAATNEELPRCFTRNWINVSLQDFIGCFTNLGINRQTRMLADLRKVGCYNSSASGLTYEERHYRMLASAKENIRGMAFFGLTAYQELSQILFEHTFNLNFVTKFEDVPANKTWSGKANLSNANRDEILHINRFDVMLYQYAKDLFFQRLQMLAERTEDTSLRRLIEARIDKY
ncbi:heparan-sulfate 6-O-sulfotransferase 3-B-like [Haliotis asinina]|uniref:heparan-sulfate 6-O-sulfotransferase 3-B-like n=1 Tax=Haliotis asinina TaxID=109174 RepID=UPI003531FF07